MGQAITDDELVAASRRGERAAFGQLVERHLDAVWAVSYSSTRNPTLSEDVAQDTFVAAWKQLDSLRETGRLRAWLCGIARNLARAARRRQRRETPVDQVDDRASLAATPYEALDAAETDRLVAGALDALPASYREVLVLYYQHDRSIRDVASALGISAEAATQRLSRGRRLLATHVVDTVEDALTRTRPRRAFVVGLVAALPPRPPPSLIARSLRSTSHPAGATMLKIAALVLAAAGAAGTAYVTTRPAAAPAAAPAPAAATRGPAAPTLAPRSSPALAAAAPSAVAPRPVAAPARPAARATRTNPAASVSPAR
ncbi:MAG: sigma-70 family RNA polymerase sigma factor [Kofleriaceae bacterium]